MNESYSAEAATKKVGSQFELVLVAAHRARQLRHGSPARVESKSGVAITALKEIAAGEYTKEEFLTDIRKGTTNEHYAKKGQRNTKRNSRSY